MRPAKLKEPQKPWLSRALLAVFLMLGLTILPTISAVLPHAQSAHAESYGFIRKWGTRGTSDGQFQNPGGITLDASGNVYVADTTNNRIQKFTSTGTWILSWGGRGTGPGQFSSPQGVVAYSAGNVYVADTGNNRIQKFTSAGEFQTGWGTRGTGTGQVSSPRGVAVDSAGNVYVADSSNSRIQKFGNNGEFLIGWGSPGTPPEQFSSPRGVAVDSAGNVYVADTLNNRMQKFVSTGGFRTTWGSLGSRDGEFFAPSSVAVDSSGNVYVADTSNNRVQVFALQRDPGPSLIAPSDGATLTSLGVSLSWSNPLNTTQYQLQVIPFNNDGPGANLVRNAAATYTLPSPPEWYGLLPDMTYVWQVRTTTVTTSPTETDWTAWSLRTFRTPKVTSATISPVSPAQDSTVGPLTPTLIWTNSNAAVFYYEVQVSKDPSFNTDPATAIAMVYWELRHGGVTNPPNSYTIPSQFPLGPGTTYHWRVRPRVQGDGTQVGWSSTFSFKTQ